MSERKALEILKLALVLVFCAAGFVVAVTNVPSPQERTCTEIRQDISPYVQCMSRAGELRCSMQVEDFRKYHELKREHARRCLLQ